MDDMTNEIRLEYWLDIVQRCNSSGKTKRQWCEDNDINEKQFYYWQRRIRTLIYKEKKSTTELVAPVFAEIPLTPNESSSGISKNNGSVVESSQNPVLTLNKGGMTIEISNLSSMELMTFAKELIYNA